nr:uncharacterized mitochondrial protein AtMg00810-like [Tanacetum cinerariifolium]
YAKGMHAVPPPITGNYIPSGSDVKIDYSKFTYVPKQTSADESDTKPVEYASSTFDSSVETTTSIHAPLDNAPKIVCKPKMWTDAPINEEYESDGDDDSVFNVQENIEKPSFAFIDSVKHAEAVNTTCYVLNKFDGKSDSGFLVGYFLNSKAFWVYNLETKRVEEHLHVNFQENKPNVVGKGHAWMFDLHYLTNSMNYKPVLVENQANKSTGPKETNNSAGDKIQKTTDYKTCEKPVCQVDQIFQEELEKLKRQEKEANDAVKKGTTHQNQNANTNSINLLNAISIPISTAGPSIALNNGEPSYPNDLSMPHLEDIYASLNFRLLPRIFRYLKGQPKLGLWYPKVSSFELEAYLDSDYAGANLDRKSTTGGCQFLGRRLISWQCKKQTIMATSTAKAEYVAAAH